VLNWAIVQDTAPTVSIIVTTFQEARSITCAIQALLNQALPCPYELVVVSPDDETCAVVESMATAHAEIRLIRDRGIGKPAALNLAMTLARGDVVVLTDGDVFVAPGAIRALLSPLRDPSIGVVSGRPVSLNPRSTMLGYWSHLLVDAGAHQQRTNRALSRQFFECSGYLYAFHRSLYSPIPEDTLAEDGLISHLIWEKGLLTAYAPDAIVYVKYPTTYGDWIRQKTRTAGGYAQSYLRGAGGMKSFRAEAAQGAWAAIRYAQSARELAWTMILFLARIHVWLRVWWDVRLRKRPFSSIWQRIHSTK